MSNIYDDVDLLKEQMSTLIPVALTEGADIHALPVGRYYVPSAAVSATLLNKPTTISYTAYIDVIPGGEDGQKTVIYKPCRKGDASYYHESYYSESWGGWDFVNLIDSGWIDLPLATGILAYNEEQKPRCRRIGNEVFLSGVMKGVTASDTVVATLPEGYRPIKRVILPIACVGQMFGKISIDTNGSITFNRSTVEPVVDINWHSIACSFSI